MTIPYLVTIEQPGRDYRLLIDHIEAASLADAKAIALIRRMRGFYNAHGPWPIHVI